MNWKALGLLIGGWILSGSALAQPYIGFSAGQADVDESMVIPGLIDPGPDARVDGKDGAFKLFGGYQFNQNFALEAALVDLGDVSYSGFFTGTPGGTVSGGRIQNSGLNLSAVGVVPLGQRFVLFGKVGMFLWYSEAADVTGGVAFYSEEDGADLSVGLGASVAIGQRVSLRAEWERFDMSNVDVDLVTFGFAYRF